MQSRKWLNKNKHITEVIQSHSCNWGKTLTPSWGNRNTFTQLG